MNDQQLAKKQFEAIVAAEFPFGYLHGFRYVTNIRRAVADGLLTVVKTISADRGPYATQYDFSDKESTGTYDACVAVTLKDDGTIALIIYDGENLHGTRTNLRVTFLLSGNDIFDLEFVQRICQNTFAKLVSDMAIDERRAEEEARVARIASKLLGVDRVEELA